MADSSTFYSRSPKALYIAAGLSGAVAFADFLFGAVYVTLLLGRAISPSLLGTMFAVSTGLSIVLEAPSGALADRYGHRRLLSIGLVVWGSSLILLATATSHIVTLAALILWTCGMALQSGTIAPLVINRTAQDQRERLIQTLMRWTQTAHWLCSALGAATVYVVGTVLDTKSIVFAAGCVLLTLACIAHIAFRESTAKSPQTVWSSLKESFGWVLSPIVRPLVLASAASSLGMTVIVVTWQPVLSPQGDVRLNGLILIGLTAAAALGSWLPKPLAISPKNQTIVGLGLIAGGLAAGSVTVPVVGYLFAEFGLGLTLTASGAWQQLSFTDSQRNTQYSTIASIGLVAALVANTLLGWLWDSIGLANAIRWLAAMIVVLALATIYAPTPRTDTTQVSQ
ncbi:MFS transporter [Actinobaculum sp. 352]|uniref:MFS transporter n=1 Tax=Actinobaculum sp. 352 TaxID=2490946 RepID=UPI000F7EF26F|nr:MFS transporter [Actinobaculum sp. 352]RTE49776.1 MFS transporter [Actinobaculum sp. 352]